MPTKQIAHGFPIRVAAKLSGLSAEMVDYLCRTRVLVPSLTKSRGRGRPRLYSFADLVILRAVAKLLQAGLSVSKLAKALGALRIRYQAITATELPFQYLFSDGSSVYLKSADEVIENISQKQQLAFAFVVELTTVRREILMHGYYRTLKSHKAGGI